MVRSGFQEYFYFKFSNNTRQENQNFACYVSRRLTKCERGTTRLCHLISTSTPPQFSWNWNGMTSNSVFCDRLHRGIQLGQVHLENTIMECSQQSRTSIRRISNVLSSSSTIIQSISKRNLHFPYHFTPCQIRIFQLVPRKWNSTFSFMDHPDNFNEGWSSNILLHQHNSLRKPYAQSRAASSINFPKIYKLQ